MKAPQLAASSIPFAGHAQLTLHVLRTDLDLSGNPIWFRPECKHRCVAELPALRRYDDEEVTELDRELAAESTPGATKL